MMTAETLAAITDEEEEQLLLPEGWQVVRLESLCSIKGGKRLPAGTDFSPTKTAFPYIRVTDFTNGTIRTSQLKYLDEETQKQIARYIINRDDIYISIAGSIGIVGTIPAELDGANLTENAARLILDQEQVDRDFLARYLQSAEGQQQIKLRTNLVGQPKRNWKPPNGCRMRCYELSLIVSRQQNGKTRSWERFAVIFLMGRILRLNIFHPAFRFFQSKT
jgi:restriction endonuclease S subunit